MDSLYPRAILQHLESTKAELDELSKIINQREPTNFEYRAAERLLQINIEAGIGIAKQWAKLHTGSTPIDSYQCFTNLAQLSLISYEQLKNWRKIIGLRNTLVHDYLNIDPQIVLDVVRHRYYNDILEFVQKGVQALTVKP